ncbi:hypothetical protein F5882DRAFT_387443 [Hyaloscypha sp. PMI_1271]|nr:hypothetical protein F5882DRAFT_387443 [Hyaloscypha sp. PMI_1271]
MHKVSQNEAEATRKIAYIIWHVARYRSIEGILLKGRRTSGLKQEDFVSECRVQMSNTSLSQNKERKHYSVTEWTPFDYRFDVALFELNASWGIRQIYPGYGQNAHEIRGIDDVEHNGEGKREIILELEITTSIPQKSVGEGPPDAFDQFFVFVCGVDDRGSPLWDKFPLPSLPVDSPLLNLDDFAVYTDRPDAGKQVDAERIAG